MVLYKFTINTYGKEPKINMDMVEVDEKPKTYQVKGIYYRGRINKSEIDCTSGCFRDTVYLLENNFERAKELFIEKMKDDISGIEIEIKRKERKLERVRNKLEVLKQLESARED